ncbi:SPBC16A3.06 tRNA-specific adenosine deaminase 1 [Candida maltosa Xu316]
MNHELGNQIAKSVIDKFNALNLKSGKPTKRSNGIEEWTVLASVVVISPDDQILPITLTTGVKTLPDKVRSYSNGLMVHDMHAEILSIRLFNYYLLTKDCPLIEFENGKYRLKKGIRLALFVSEPPCGDMSMNYISSSKEDNVPWEHSSQEEVNRGRNNFGNLGVVRTKPGRSDSLISYSKSCSDKLCLKQLTGIGNAVTSSVFDERIYLDFLVTPKVMTEDFERCFYDRLNLPDVHRLQLLTYDYDKYLFGKADHKTPSPLSLLHIVPTGFTEVLNNGVKNGAYVKNKPPRAGGESTICNRNMIKQLKSIKEIDFEDYLTFKNSNTTRQTLKKAGREELQDWICTSDDNFDLS